MGPAHGDPIQRTKTQARVGPARCEKSCGTTVWKNKPDGNVIFWWTSALMADPFPIIGGSGMRNLSGNGPLKRIVAVAGGRHLPRLEIACQLSSFCNLLSRHPI